MKLRKKHPYLFWELIGLLVCIIPTLVFVGIDAVLFFVFDKDFLDVALWISLITVLIGLNIMIFSPVVVKNKKDKIQKIEKIEKNVESGFYEKETMKKVVKSGQKEKTIGIILLIIGVIFTLCLIISCLFEKDYESAFGAGITFFILTCVIPFFVVIDGNNKMKNPKKYDYNRENVTIVKQSGTIEKMTGFKAMKSKWCIDEAIKVYCKQTGKNQEELNFLDGWNDEIDLIWQYAGAHIAFFVAWLVENDYWSGEFDIGEEEVKNREISAYTIVRDLDESLIREDISEDIWDFVDDYIEGQGEISGGTFYNDYENFVKDILNKEIYSFAFSWEDYDKFKPILDNRYNTFKKDIICKIQYINCNNTINKIKEIINNELHEHLKDIPLSELEENGKIYYMNGQNGTIWDWKMNEKTSDFMCFYKDGSLGAIKLMIYKDGSATIFLYKYRQMQPFFTKEISDQFNKNEVLKLAIIMNMIMDKNNIFDKAIDEYNYDINISEEDMKEFNSEN